MAVRKRREHLAFIASTFMHEENEGSDCSALVALSPMACRGNYWETNFELNYKHACLAIPIDNHSCGYQ